MRATTLAFAAVVSLVAGACGSGSMATNSPAGTVGSAAPTAPTVPTPAATVCASANPGTIRWFVGIDGGDSAVQAAAEREFVRKYNERAACNGDRTLTLEIQPADRASDALKIEIAKGDEPDIVGPIGLRARNGFAGLYLDLNDLVAKHAVNMTAFTDIPRAFYEDDGDYGNASQPVELTALPYVISPGFIWYDADKLQLAGLPPLPTKAGQTYRGVPWDWNELKRVAADMTVDSKGRRSTDPKFDSKHIATYGMDFGSADAMWMASCFGAGTFLDDTFGLTAFLPPLWHDAYSWYFDAMWTRHVIPTAPVEASDLLGKGNPMSSGHVAMMATTPEGLTGLIGSAATSPVRHWNLAVLPSWAGTTTSPMDAIGFSIVKPLGARASRDIDQAFKALLAIQTDDSLLAAYGGVPAAKSKQAAYFAGLDARIEAGAPGNAVDWSVIDSMAATPAVPTPFGNMPSYTQVRLDIATWWARLRTTPNLRLDYELGMLIATLRQDFQNSMTQLNQ